MKSEEYSIMFDMPHMMATISRESGDKFHIKSGDEGDMGALFEMDTPLMRKDLTEILKKQGAKNLEVSKIVITEDSTKEKYTNYLAVKIQDVVEPNKTEYETSGEKFIKELNLDGKNNSGLVIFRLPKSLGSRIIVSRSIADEIESNADLESVWFQELDKALFNSNGQLML